MSADSLCLSCGICCDGTLYGSVVLEPAERERVERVGLRVLVSVRQGQEPELTMPQPCSALRGVLCSVYEDRPASCARYECSLRRGVAAGAPLAEALVTVGRMHELLAIIRAGFECEPGASIWERILAMESPTTPAEEQAAARRYGPAIEAVGELLGLGRSAFEPRFAGGGRR